MPSHTLTTIDVCEKVWRVGFPPDPWSWSGWEYATDGRFQGRWDDVDGNFRTVYAGSSLLACLLEVLAGFRKDARLAVDLESIVEDQIDRQSHPTVAPGLVPRQWLESRRIATGTLAGTFCAVAASGTVASLYSSFIGLALSLGLADFDAAALKNARPRRLTQSVATWLYVNTAADGVSFSSRHGDDVALWAVFERPQDGRVSASITDTGQHAFTGVEPALMQACWLLGLRWT